MRRRGPSCLSTRERAEKRESEETRRVTWRRRKWRETKKEAVEPRMVAVETMNQLHSNPGSVYCYFCFPITTRN